MQITYENVPNRPFPLSTGKRGRVQTTLVGEWRRRPEHSGDDFVRGDMPVGWKVQLEDGTEIAVDELMNQWGETAIGIPGDD